MPDLLPENKLDEIRGKILVGHASMEESRSFLEYVNFLEGLLAEADMDDYFGTEGWRHRAGWD